MRPYILLSLLICNICFGASYDHEEFLARTAAAVTGAGAPTEAIETYKKPSVPYEVLLHKYRSLRLKYNTGYKRFMKLQARLIKADKLIEMQNRDILDLMALLEARNKEIADLKFKK